MYLLKINFCYRNIVPYSNILISPTQGSRASEDPHVWKISKKSEETMEYNEKHIGSNLKFEFSIRNIKGEEHTSFNLCPLSMVWLLRTLTHFCLNLMSYVVVMIFFWCTEVEFASCHIEECKQQHWDGSWDLEVKPFIHGKKLNKISTKSTKTIETLNTFGRIIHDVTTKKWISRRLCRNISI